MPAPHATRAEYNRALEGVDFPAAKDAIVRAAMDKGGIDAELASVLKSLPEYDFESREELDASIARAYAAGEGFEDAGPAAKPKGRAPDPAVKDATEGA
jgi:hypothetical protein